MRRGVKVRVMVPAGVDMLGRAVPETALEGVVVSPRGAFVLVDFGDPHGIVPVPEHEVDPVAAE